MRSNDFDLSEWQSAPQPRRLPPAAEAAIGLGTSCLMIVAAEALLLALIVHLMMRSGGHSRTRKPAPAPRSNKTASQRLTGAPRRDAGGAEGSANVTRTR